MATLIGAGLQGRFVFTSGATEATNIALRGLAMGPGSRRVASAVEDRCARATLADLGRYGIVTTTMNDVDFAAERLGVEVDAHFSRARNEAARKTTSGAD